MRPHIQIEQICKRYGVSPKQLTKNWTLEDREKIAACKSALVNELLKWGFSFPEIADILSMSEGHCMKLSRRTTTYEMIHVPAVIDTTIKDPQLAMIAKYLKRGDSYGSIAIKAGYRASMCGAKHIQRRIAFAGGEDLFIHKHLRA